ncbi:hypothetical protein SSX86_007456 [Deinandra increscens subsp. villosa]|uniref:Transposase n=1 Tax=Deinandra increscens subsp. villosa TaxID=3103831 RepID=A0AAP0DLC7_9ASTR
MDKSWMKTSRTTQSYADGVKSFLLFAVTNLESNEIPCPCVNCLNHYTFKADDVEFHLFSKGFDQTYRRWDKHGEIDEPAGEELHTESFFDSGVPLDAAETIKMVRATEENFDEDHEKFQERLMDAEKPLYEGCHTFTKLSALVHLLNLKTKHGGSDKLFNELLVLLKQMLPEGNEIVKNTYEAKKILKSMGAGYTKIHVCINDCILYRKENKDLTVCPTCGESRLKRLFQVKTTAEDLRWHATSSKTPGVLRHPSDSPAWKAIDDKYPEIADDPRSLRLGISTDGVDVNRGNRNHSMWPVLSVIYNLPPWLCMKRKFIMLSLLISGAPGNDIDVFLEPLIDHLELLFEAGVETYDAYAQEQFTLRAVVLWTINDYPALGTLCGCPYSGFRGCVVCREETKCIRLPFSAKQCYAGQRRYLPYTHAFRKQTEAFNGKQELEVAADPMTGEQIYNEVQQIRNKWRKGLRCTDSEILETSTGRGGKIDKRKRKNKEKPPYWKKFNIWFRRLRYWRHNSVQHCIDFMHIKKNVAESLVGTLLNLPRKTKDGLNARKDLNFLGLRPELQPKQNKNNIVLPAASYTLQKDEKEKFCDTLYNLKVPQGYCSNFSSLVSLKDKKLVGLKSHDYHMLMQRFLPIAIRSVMPEPTRYAIIRLYFFFKSICSKEINVEELDKLQADLCVTLCLLEKYFPPSFFDVMLHLTVHLTREHSSADGSPGSAGRSVEVSPELLSKAHLFVLLNTPEIEHYIEEHMKFLEKEHPGSRLNNLTKKQSTTFGKWLRNKVEKEMAESSETISETVRWISHGPHISVRKYEVYDINGYSFRTKFRDGRVYQNSGVGVEVNDMHISNEVLTYGRKPYYGVLKEIWLLDYHIKTIPLFMCDWVENTQGVKKDSLGYTLVNLKRLGHKEDPFIFASQAQQLFYVKDQLDKKLHIVFMTPPRNYRDYYEDDANEEFSTVVFPHNDNVLPSVDARHNVYHRANCTGMILRKTTD